jgi:hypothetical protein
MVVAILALAMMLTPYYGSAEPPDPKDTHGAVVRTIELQPKPGSDVIVEDLHAIVWEDGAVSVRGSGSGVAGQLQSFSYEVDLESESYTTTLLESRAVAPPAGRLMMSDHVARVNVVTEDVAQLDVAETLHRLHWTISGGVVTWGYGQIGCWEKNPTLAGTHWFEDYCTWGSLSINNFSAAQSSFGRYYNYDFADDSQSTWTEHSIQIYGYYTTGYNFNWDVTSWGEYSNLLHGGVTSCGCF